MEKKNAPGQKTPIRDYKRIDKRKNKTARKREKPKESNLSPNFEGGV